MSAHEESLEVRPASPQEIAETAKQETQRLVGEAKDTAQQFATEQKDVAAGFLRDVAGAFHKGAEELKYKGHGGAASAVDWTAEEVESLATELSHRSPSEMLREIEGFARRQPALAAGAAFLVGFGILRFLQSSSQDPVGAGAYGQSSHRRR